MPFNLGFLHVCTEIGMLDCILDCLGDAGDTESVGGLCEEVRETSELVNLDGDYLIVFEFVLVDSVTSLVNGCEFGKRNIERNRLPVIGLEPEFKALYAFVVDNLYTLEERILNEIGNIDVG